MRRDKHTKEQLEALMIEFGVTDYEFGHGKKHPFIRWRQDGQRFTFYYSGSCGENRAIHNALSDCRRMLISGKAGNRT